MEELEPSGEEVVDLEGHRSQEEHDEPEVDHRVHDPRARVAHQRLHGEPVGETGETFLPVTGAFLGTALLPALSAQGEEVEGQPQEGRYPEVEDHHYRVGNVAEHLPAHLEMRVLLDGSEEPQRQCAPRGENADRLEHLGRGRSPNTGHGRRV
jgi:hypothetical protein